MKIKICTICFLAMTLNISYAKVIKSLSLSLPSEPGHIIIEGPNWDAIVKEGDGDQEIKLEGEFFINGVFFDEYIYKLTFKDSTIKYIQIRYRADIILKAINASTGLKHRCDVSRDWNIRRNIYEGPEEIYSEVIKMNEEHDRTPKDDAHLQSCKAHKVKSHYLHYVAQAQTYSNTEENKDQPWIRGWLQDHFKFDKIELISRKPKVPGS